MERKHCMRSNTLLSSPQFYVPKTLCKEFVLEVEEKGETRKLLATDCNLKRAYHVIIGREVTAIRLVPKANWGDSASTDVFSFDFV